MLRGVVFDFDGVIVDSHPLHLRAWSRFFESIGVVVPEGQLEFVMDGRKREEILDHFLGELSEAKPLEYGDRKDEIFFDEASKVRPVKGLLRLLEDLEREHVVLSFASSGSRHRVCFLLNQLGLMRFFTVVLAGDDVCRGKPDPAIFLKAASGLGIDPVELIAFEDAVSGVRAARAAGMKCLGIARPECSSMPERITLRATSAHSLARSWRKCSPKVHFNN